MAGLVDILGSIVLVALVATIVAHPASASIITAAGNAFSGSLKSAEAG
jgi:hypothetical protein